MKSQNPLFNLIALALLITGGAALKDQQGALAHGAFEQLFAGEGSNIFNRAQFSAPIANLSNQ
jgi:hypothetical protein